MEEINMTENKVKEVPYLEPINISNETLALLHREYNDVTNKAKTLPEIPKMLYFNLKEKSEIIPEEDSDIFWTFMDGLKKCWEQRERTFEITDFITDLNSVIMYIIRFLNETKNAGIDIDWYGRRKALDRELTKILNKSVFDTASSAFIRDRFGLRGILMVKETTPQTINQIQVIYKSIGTILAKDTPLKGEFINWYKENPDINYLAKTKLDIILDLPFEIISVKDYISHPKENGYQSLQFTLQTTSLSKILPGFQIEIQLRDLLMHNRAEGLIEPESPELDQSHLSYENEIDPRIAGVFVIDDCSLVKLPGFVDYKNENKFADRDGLHSPKHFSDRRSF